MIMATIIYFDNVKLDKCSTENRVMSF